MKLKGTKTIVAFAGLLFTTNTYSMQSNEYDQYIFHPTRFQLNSPNNKAEYFASSSHFFIISGIDNDQRTLVQCLNGTDLKETKTILESPFSQYSHAAQQLGIAPYGNGLVINTDGIIKLWSITDTGIREETSPLKLDNKMNMISCNGHILATQGWNYNDVTFYDLRQPEISWNLHIPEGAYPYLPWNNFGTQFLASTNIRQQFYLITPVKENSTAISMNSRSFDLDHLNFAMDPTKDCCLIAGRSGNYTGKREHYMVKNILSGSFIGNPITSPLPENYYTKGIFFKEKFVFEIGELDRHHGGCPGYFTIYNRDGGEKIWGADLKKRPMSVELINNHLFVAYGNYQHEKLGGKYQDQEIVIFDIDKFISNHARFSAWDVKYSPYSSR